jgi:Sensors of blue-light using FAD
MQNQEFIDPDRILPNAGYYQLAYCSILKEPMSPQAMQTLVEKAQISNARSEVTGLMMVDNLLVVQWIEGRRAAVRSLWDKLQTDPRHHCIVQLLHRDFQEQRMYPNWAMQLTSRSDMLAILHDARASANKPFGLPSPWAPAISALCLLIDPEFAQNYASLPESQQKA